MMKLKVGSRTSLLAMTQTQMAMNYMKNILPELEWEIVGIKSKGDQDQKTSLRVLGGEGIFVRRLEEALVSGEIDIAIHSAKDVPTRLHSYCVLAGVLPRANPRDILIVDKSFTGYKKLNDLPEGLKIGTGSLRRQSQLARFLPKVEWIDIRGNIDTRLKLVGSKVDGIVLAKAGVERLGLERLEDYHWIGLELEQCLPAPGQGFLGIEVLQSNQEVRRLLEEISDRKAKRHLTCERAFLETLGLSCTHPLAVYACGEDRLSLSGYLAKDISSEGYFLSLEGEDPINLGKSLAKSLSELVSK